MRLTATVLEQVLKLNEGFTWTTNNNQKNFSESRTYLIEGGKLLIQAAGKTSWADSRYKNTWAAEGADLRRLLHTVLHQLKLPN